MASVIRGSGESTLGGALDVQGVLTYEDVTSVDSVGIITARSGIILSEDNAIHFRGATDSDKDAILRAAASGGQLLINSRNDTILNIDSNNDSTDAYFAVAHGAATGSSTELFRVQENGRVGIGTDNPVMRLHIHGAANSVDSRIRLSSVEGSGLTIRAQSATENNINADGGEDITFSIGNIESLRISSAGNIGIGTNAPRGKLEVSDGTSNTAGEAINEAYIVGATTGNSEGILTIQSNNAMASDKGGSIAFGGRAVTGSSAGANWAFINGYKENGTTANYGGYLSFATRPNTGSISEQMRLDSSGRLLIGTSSSRDKFFGSLGAALQVEGSTTPFCSLAITRNGATGDSSKLVLAHARGTANQILLNDDAIGDISWQGADGSKFCQAASIRAFVDGTPGTDNMPGRIEFSTNGGTVNPTQRMRIGSNGYVYYGNQTHANPAANAVSGLTIRPDPLINMAANNNSCLTIGRNGNDGALVVFYQAGTSEGSINVSGTSVAINGAHLSRWSQLPGGVERTEILRGSVLSNLDEMCEWGEEDNEQLNRMQVSSVEGDRNVAGVFQDWDDDDDTYVNDFHCAMTGDFVIRIAQGTTVARGDLLMSAGDGTAKPQDDDIMRSKTIAKVTSTNVSETYADGSYCVPCVLMAC